MTAVNTQIGLPTNWVAPKKPPYRESILNDEDIKKVIITHSKQPSLNRVQAEKLKNNFKKQLCIVMLCQGFHKSFRELDLILKLQIADRHRLGSEHPVWDRPLLDNENTKIEYLAKKLNSAELAERVDDFKTVYTNYLDLASYFLIHDDSWLSDYFYEKCLKITYVEVRDNVTVKLDDIKLAEAHCNMGLSYERQTTDYTKKPEKIKDAYFQSLEHFEKYYDLTNGQDWTKKNDFPDLNNNETQQLEKIKTTSVESYLLKLEDQRMFIDACIHLQRIQRIIANRFSKDPEEKIMFLSKAYQVCKTSLIGALEGEASLLLGNAYAENSKLDIGLSFYNNYYEISRRDKDTENFGKASEAVAKCYEKMGKVEKSIEYLEKYLKEVSGSEVDYQYSRACSCLASIYNSMGKYDIAAEYSQKAFEVSRQMNRSDAVEYNRILFGISKAHANLKNFNHNIELANRKTVNNLMTWKYDPRKDKIKILDDKDIKLNIN